VPRLEIKREMAPGDIEAVSELLAFAAKADGHAPLGEHQWLDLVQGGREGFAGLVAWEPGHDHPVGYAQLTREPDREGHARSWQLEFVVDPHHRTDDGAVGRTVVENAVGIVRNEGGGHVHMWVSKPTPAHDRIAEEVGLKRGRELLQMRRPLPVEREIASTATPIDLRPFRPGEDEAAWLEVNNRAFEWHPEQGGWDMATLLEREQLDWFDPAGFLLHERDGRLAGFCWTKVHADADPPLGEIYVIATDPDFQGLGLGRALTLAGLDSLARRGITVGMLYVDGENTRAVALYRDLGFELNHVDRAYVGDF
jgi:mycothiol synthase